MVIPHPMPKQKSNDNEEHKQIGGTVKSQNTGSEMQQESAAENTPSVTHHSPHNPIPMLHPVLLSKVQRDGQL